MKILTLLAVPLFYFCKQIKGIEVECKYPQSSGFGYCCMVQNFELITSKDDREITAITGQHMSGKNNDDVKYFRATERKVQFFPRAVTKYFKNIETVQIESAGLREITKNDLKQFGEKLTLLWLSYNKLKVIESDLFEFNKNLGAVSFDYNEILHVGSGAFNTLNDLRDLGFRDNKCFNFHAYNRFQVFDLKKDLERNCKM